MKVKNLPKGIRFIQLGLEDDDYNVMLEEKELTVEALLKLLKLPEIKGFDHLNFWVESEMFFQLKSKQP